MFGVDSTEFLVVAVVALLVIGPKDLPQVLRKVGHWVGKARGVARHFRSGLDTMIRESELDDMEKSWREENERVMREHPWAGSVGGTVIAVSPPIEADAPTANEPASPGHATTGDVPAGDTVPTLDKS